MLAATAPAGAQEGTAPTSCENGRISKISIDSRSIFATDDLGEGSPLRWLYRLANRLHVNTRDSFIRREVLFKEGDCVDPAIFEESGRILRQYPFIATADIHPVTRADGSVEVQVATRDEWSTQVDVGVAVDAGLQLERINITEENLLGQGVLASIFFRRRREKRDAGITIQQPRLFGTRTDANFGVGRTRVGTFFNEEVTYPFVGEFGRFAARQTYRRRDRLFTYSAEGSDALTHTFLPFDEEWAELSAAARVGRPGNLTLFGLGITRERVRFGGFPGDVEVSVDGSFDETLPAPPEAQQAVASQTHGRRTTRVNFLIGQRNVRFARVRGLDALDGDRDVRLGTDIGLTIARSVDVLTSDSLNSGADLFSRFRFFAGFDPGASYIFANLALEGRRLISGRSEWRDVIGEFDLYAYFRSTKAPGPGHTLFARVSGSGGWSVDTPFQLTLGGREGVRGFREEEAPGARRLLLSLEDRVFFRWPAPKLMDFGFTLFADAGRVWSGGVPYGTNSDWRGTLGAGIRIGFPARTRTVGRIDIAFPIGGRSDQGPIFRVTLFELLGVGAGFSDSQLNLTRRNRIGPDFFVIER
jgi:hypothetical protein